MSTPPGTQGYAAEAAVLVPRYEAIPFEEKHGVVLHLLPAAPARIVDLGAGTGADAAWFAARGHRVLAVEPTAELREAGRRLHPSPAIEWLDDALPELARVRARGEAFDAVLLTAVWMHLDEAERRAAMPRVASLVAPGGVLVMALRHGPVPAGRRMFDVSGAETAALAGTEGLERVLEATTPSLNPQNRADGVTWTRIAFARPKARAA